jgi:hypothetical protein
MENLQELIARLIGEREAKVKAGTLSPDDFALTSLRRQLENIKYNEKNRLRRQEQKQEWSIGRLVR